MHAAYSPAFEIDRSPLRKPRPHLLFPVFLTVEVSLQDVAVFAGIPSRARVRRAVPADKIRSFPEPPVVLGIVAARLGDVVPQVKEHLVPDEFLPVNLPIRRDLFSEVRNDILPVPFERDIPRLMVEPRADVGDLAHRRADPPGQHSRRPLDAVAKSRDPHVRRALHGPAKHGHRVGVIQKQGVRAEPLDVPGDVAHHGNGAQRPEDAGHAAGVADVDIHAVFHRDFDVMTPHLNAPGQDGAHDEIRSRQGLPAVEMGLDSRRVSPRSMMLFTARTAKARRSGLMSTREIVASRSVGNVRRSRTSPG